METGIRHRDRHSLFLWLPRRDWRQVSSVLSALSIPRLSGPQSQSSEPRSDDHHERPESCLVPFPQPAGGVRAALVVLVPAPLALPAAVRPHPAGDRPLLPQHSLDPLRSLAFAQQLGSTVLYKPGMARRLAEQRGTDWGRRTGDRRMGRKIAET